MKKIINFAHLFLDELTDSSKILIDFTLGNGHDSAYFISKVKKLYAFDIQQQALDQSRKNYPILNNANLILDSHENIDYYIKNFDLGIFNLGYLPHGDKSVTTTAKSTIEALSKAIHLLNPNGRIVIVVYIGHLEGKIESQSILGFLEKQEKITISKFEIVNRKSAPYIIIIDK